MKPANDAAVLSPPEKWQYDDELVQRLANAAVGVVVECASCSVEYGVPVRLRDKVAKLTEVLESMIRHRSDLQDQYGPRGHRRVVLLEARARLAAQALMGHRDDELEGKGAFIAR